MFHLYQSNKLESLFDQLCTIIEKPLSRALAPEEIVVQNQGMARWLSQQIAARKGIAANLEFPLPARFIWRIFSSQLEIADDVQDFNRQTLLWRIFELLGNVAHTPEFAEIRNYLQDDNDGRKLFQLAGRIADVFDQYLVYRPELPAKWEAGDGNDWQAILWRMVTHGGVQHRAGLFEKFRVAYHNNSLNPSGLPERIILFGVSSLAPAYLDVLSGVSTIAEVHLFHLSPCRAYWFDLVSDKDMAKKRSVWRKKNLPDVSEYYESANALLASMGMVGQEFSYQLSDLEAREIELYEESAGDSLLSVVQREILDLEISEDERIAVAGTENDNSMQFHICHSWLREIQVLHDRLLELFDQYPDLKPGDILVMAPNIEAYEPAVRAVFDSVPQERYIPWSLADRSVKGEQPLVHAFLSLFDLLTSRFEAPAVIAFLENECVGKKFGIDEEGIGVIRNWVRECGIRWGMDSEHRSEYGYEMSDVHSWSFGLKRMLLGFVAGEQADMFQGIAPYLSFSTSDSVLLGKLTAFVECLHTWSGQLQAEKIVGEWAEMLRRLLDAFFEPGNSEGDLNALLVLRETIADWLRNCQTAGLNRKIGLPVVAGYFNDTLAKQAEGQAFLSGRVTFCNMVPMRSVPFAVTWLLGMNDTDYPRSQKPVAFDLIGQEPRPGDRNRRNDDCYLFLEALISARKVFGVSWIGRDQQDNSIRSPSSVVSTLLDYLHTKGHVEVGDDFIPPCIKHPLQPFSSRCFDTSLPTASYAAQWLPGNSSGHKKTFLDEPLPPPDDSWYALDLQQLVRFWGHPVQYFLRERLGIDLRDYENLLPEKEPFFSEGLDRYFLTQELTNDLLSGKSVSEKYQLLQATGKLPHGNFGRNEFEEMSSIAEDFVATLTSFSGEPLEDLEVDSRIERFNLTGWVRGLTKKGLVRFRSAKLKSKDLLNLWIEHLAYNMSAPDDYPCTSYYVALDSVICLQPVDDPAEILRELLGLYWKGSQEPLRFYPRTSEAFFLAQDKGKPFNPGKTWNSGFKYNGEGDDPFYVLAFNGSDPFGSPFVENAMKVFKPLYDCMEELDATV